MADVLTCVPDALLRHLQEPRLVQLTTLDAEGAPFVNVISWVTAPGPERLRLVGDTRARFVQNLSADGRVALTVYGAGSAWTVYGTANVVRTGLSGLPPTFALVEVTGLQVVQVMFLGAVLTQAPEWDVPGGRAEAERFDRLVFEAMCG